MFDLEEVIKELRDEISKAGRSPWVVGRVSAANTSNQTADVTVKTANGDMVLPGMAVLGNYIPEAGHDVFVMMSGNAPIVMPPAKTIVSAAPAQVTGLAVTGGIGTLTLTWASIIEADVKWNRGYYQVQVATDAGFSAIVKAYDVAANSSVVTGLTTGTTYYVRVRAIDYVGTVGTYSTTVTGVPIGVVTADLSGVTGLIKTVGTLPTLPDAAYPPTTVVMLSSDGKLYRNFGNVWTAQVPSVDITGTLISEQLSGVTSGDNVIPNGGFEDLSLANASLPSSWSLTPQGGTPTFGLTTTQQASGLRALSIAVSNVTHGGVAVTSLLIPCSPGDVWAMQDTVKATVTTTDAHYLRAFFYDASISLITTADAIGNGPFTTSYVTAGGQVTAPANTKYVQFAVYAFQPDTPGTFYFDNVSAKKVITASQIAPLTITAGEIANGVITGGKLVPDTIGSTQIGPSAVGIAELATGAVTADKTAFVVGGGNMIVNSSFENSVAWDTGWSYPTSGVVTWTSSTAFALYGPTSAKMTCLVADFGTNSGHFGNIWQDIVRKNENGAMTASCWIKGPVGRTIGLTVIKAYDNGAGGPLFPWDGGYPGDAPLGGTAVTTTTATGQWQRVSVTFPKYTGSAVSYGYNLRYGLGGFSITWAVGEVLYIDGMQAEMAEVMTAYAPKVDEILPLTIGSPELTAGAVTVGKVSAGAIQAGNIAANGVQAGNIDAGVITSREIQSKSITTDRLMVGSFDNLIQNPGMEANTTGVPHTLLLGATLQLTGGRSASKCINVPDGAAGIYMYPNGSTYTMMPSAAQGDQFYFEFYFARASAGVATDGVSAQIGFVDAAGGYLASTNSGTQVPTSGAYQKCAFASPPAPAGTAAVFIFMERQAGAATGATLIDDLYLRRMMDGNVIIDGSLTASEIQAGSLTSGTIAAGAITAEKLSVYAIGDSVLPNGGFEEASATDNTLASRWVRFIGPEILTTADKQSGTQAMRWTPAGGSWAGIISDTIIPVVAGEQWYMSLWAKASGTNAGTSGQTVAGFFDQTGAFIGGTAMMPFSDVIPATWTKFQSTLTVPAGVTGARVAVYTYLGHTGATITVDSVEFRKVVVTAGIADGAITANKVQTNSLTTKQLIVASFDNLIQNPGLEGGTSGLPHAFIGGTFISASGGRSGPYCAVIPDGVATNALRLNGDWGSPNGHIAAAVGDSFYFEFYARRATTAVDGINAGFVILDAGGSVIGVALGPAVAPVSTSWEKVSHTFTVSTAGAAFVAPYVDRLAGANTGSTVIDDFYCRRMAEGSMIVDGTITATEIAAGAITTEKLTIASIGQDSVIPNGGFEEPTEAIPTLPARWSYNNTWGTGTPSNVSMDFAAPYAGTANLKLNPGSGAASAVQSAFVPCAAGELWYLSYWVKKTGSGITGFYSSPLGNIHGPGDGAWARVPDTWANMDLPTSWTKHELQFTVPAGNTSLGVLFLNFSTNTGATVHVDQVELRKVTVSAQIKDGAITTPKILAGNVVTAHMAAGTINANVLTAGTIVGNQLQAGTIQAAQIGAGQITTEKMTIASLSENAVPNGDFEDASAANVNIPANWNFDYEFIASGSWVWTSSTADKVTGFQSMALTNSGGGNISTSMGSQSFPVQAGDTWYVSENIKLTGTSMTGHYFRVYFFSGAPFTRLSGTMLSFIDIISNGAVTAGSWIKNEGQVVVPANATHMVVSVYYYNLPTSTTAWTDSIVARRATVSAVIKDGAITANKIGAAQITAGKLDVDSVFAANIAADQITGSELAALNLAVGKWIRSASYTAGVSGWSIDSNGNVDFNNGVFRGILDASVVRANTITPDTTLDLAVNGNAELATTARWSTTAGTVTNTTSNVHSGSRAILWSWTSAQPNLNFMDYPNGVAVVPFASYVIDFWILRGGSTNIAVTPFTSYFTSGGANVPMPNGETLDLGGYAYTAFGAYSRYQFITRAPATAVSMRFGLATTAVSTQSMYIDDVTIYRTTALDGGYLEPNLIKSKTEVWDLTGTVMPPGALIPWAGVVDTSGVYGGGGKQSGQGTISLAGYPTGWLPCDGRAVSRATYWRLFSVTGTTYGVGDGSTTFNLPDLRGRALVALDNLGGTAANRILAVGSSLGAAGGAESHQLSATEMPAHTHPLQQTLVASGINVTVSSQAGGTAGATGFTGGGQFHNNLQPFMFVNYLIKA